MLDLAPPSFRCLVWTLLISISSLSAAFAEDPPPPNSAAASGVSTPHIAFAPDGTVSSFVAEEGGLNLVLKEKPGRGFYLVTLDGSRVQAVGFTVETRLDKVEQTGNTLVVSQGGNLPRFTFGISRGRHYLALTLQRVEGVPAKSLTSLHFEMLCSANLLSLRITPMVGVEIRGGEFRADWNYLWHRNSADPRGAFAVYAAGDPAKQDEALYEIWTSEDFPRPAVKEPWTPERARQWVADFVQRYSDQTMMIVGAQSPEELYQLTEYAKQAGVKEIYLHTDTWREEYWPIQYSHVRVYPRVFPAGLADLQKFTHYLRQRGMFVGLHYVCAGIGPADPHRILGHVSRNLASWGQGTLKEPLDELSTTILFRPGLNTELPLLGPGGSPGLLAFYFDRNFVRIDEEIVRVGRFENTDQPVWTLQDCTRGWGGTSPTAHAQGADSQGLISAYGQNFVPDLDSPLFGEMVREYADFINAADVSHLIYDGYEIHAQQPWGPRKFSDAVSRLLDHPTLSGTSGGRPVESNIEYQFSNAKTVPCGLGALVTASIITEGHRRATSLLDVNYEISYQVARGGKQFAIQKPEPMFGITIATLNTHGLARQILDSIRLWKELTPKLSIQQQAYLQGKFTPVKSRLSQAGQHSEGPDLFMAGDAGDAYELVPTRVMLRKEGDVPWLSGQEFGPTGPRQFIQPGDAPLVVENPFAAQPARFAIHVLPELVGEVTAEAAQMPQGPATGTALQPQTAEIQNQRFAQFQQDGQALIVSAENAKATDVWIEEGLPSWSSTCSMVAGRGISMDVTGDGSGAVLVLQAFSAGVRDYVVKINFTGKRSVIIPNGEVSWADGNWGWRFGAKHFDYHGNVSRLALGFGYIPARTSPRVKVENLRVLADQASKLVNPVITTGAGTLTIDGEIATSQYVQYDGGDQASVYDENWNKVRDVQVHLKDFTMPTGFAPVAVQVADGSPRPWLEVQFMTRGEPMRVGK
ncbi:MAG: hypothetical protein ACYC3X_11335 [Pirellulaceae bacterium]